ncbi:MAG: preprotein translocase subunit SecA [Mycoplasmataceae bacterium]|nr:preprotein translocase subunit SecA [Mycoplasmataceae bacterium]
MKHKKNTQQSISLRHYKILHQAEAIANDVLALIKTYRDEKKTEDFLKKRTLFFKKELLNGKKIDDFITETFALACYAIEITYQIKMYKVQIMGGYVLHRGDVAEMKTGEGKTLTAILPAYLNALIGKGVHIITVNEYLSSRDAKNTQRVFSKLGITVGLILTKMNPKDKKEAYHQDVTYATNAEIGFDHLRDYMVKNNYEKTHRKNFTYAIVDEVDSILIDEARTPLIIAGGQAVSDGEYFKANDFVKTLAFEIDYEVDKETKQAYLTPDGALKAETFYGFKNLYSYNNSETVHRIHNALQANFIYRFDVDYTVKAEEIVLIDIFTGRMLEGRTFSEGLNQAIEAKENLKIKPENKTFASVTYQNLFRMYDKLSGMSGTAFSEEEELLQIYNMRVVELPTNRPLIRVDRPDLIFSTMTAKFDAVVEKIKEIHQNGQPILVGTKSITDSEYLAKLLDEEKISYEILNAKNHAREADIISNAGQRYAVTLSTNMAGRGTDIKLGEGIASIGGLFVIGTERYESRRIDNQLRGRSGRQGDIGYSQFFVSLEDDIMVRAGLKRIQRFMKSLDESPIESKMVQKAITISQKKMEGINFDQRKSIIEYDDVLNRQRLITYKQRDSILESDENILDIFIIILERFIKNKVNEKVSYDNGTFNSIKLIQHLNHEFSFHDEIAIDEKDINLDDSVVYLTAELKEIFTQKFIKQDKERVEVFIRRSMLNVLDFHWQNHLDKIQKLKSGIRYRQYAQKNPVQAYVLEADSLFQIFKKEIVEHNVVIIFSVNLENNKEQVLSTKKRHTKEIIVS